MKDIPLPSDYDDFDPHSSHSSKKLCYEVKTSPQVYLKYAIDDIGVEKSGRNLVNAISNAKRALHLQVETLANAFGYKEAASKKWSNFHEYLEYCKKCGVVTPRILKKLNRVRNAVEHEYYTPTESEAEDFIDVVELFLAATDKFVYQFPTELEFLPGEKIKDNAPDIRYIKLEPFSGKIMLTLYLQESQYKNNEDFEVYDDREPIEISSGDALFFTWLRFMIEKIHKS